MGLNIYAALAVIISLALAGGLCYYKGYHNASVTWETKYNLREEQIKNASIQEANRQAQVNALAKAQEQKVLEQLQAENDALDARIKELEDEATKDPDADKPALNDAARMRIDSVH